jgi:hypothetical protein
MTKRPPSPFGAARIKKAMQIKSDNFRKVNIMNLGKLSLSKRASNQSERVTTDYDQVMDDRQHEGVSEPALINMVIRCISENSKRSPQGRRFSGLEKYFTLLSFMGPHYYGLLHATLLFPSYRTIHTYRNQILDEIGINGNIFDGTIENMTIILNKCLPDPASTKAILAVDSAYVTPYVSVQCDGTVKGLVSPKPICLDLAQHIIN